MANNCYLQVQNNISFYLQIKTCYELDWYIIIPYLHFLGCNAQRHPIFCRIILSHNGSSLIFIPLWRSMYRLLNIILQDDVYKVTCIMSSERKKYIYISYAVVWIIHLIYSTSFVTTHYIKNTVMRFCYEGTNLFFISSDSLSEMNKFLTVTLVL